MTKEATPKHMIELAKKLRRNQTDAEKLMWHYLRNRQLANAKFRRQQSVEGLIADFYCHEHKLVIELDGSQHFTKDGIEKDAQRTARLNALGIDVMRFDNRQVLTQIEAVLQMIYEKLQHPLPEGEGVKSACSEIGTIQSQGAGCSSSPLPLGEDLGEGLLIKKNLMGLGYEF
jgi:type I restriction enzyme M protein